METEQEKLGQIVSAQQIRELKEMRPRNARSQPATAVPSHHEWNFSKINRSPEHAQRIIYVWEFAREWMSTTHRPPPGLIGQLLRSAFSRTGGKVMTWTDEIVKTPFLSLPPDTQREIFAGCEGLALRVATTKFGDKRLSIQARHLPEPQFGPTKDCSRAQRKILNLLLRKDRDEQWQKFRADFEADDRHPSLRWLIARFDLNENDDDLRARFGDWLQRARANGPEHSRKKASANSPGGGGFQKALMALGKYRIAISYRRAFDVLPHQVVRGQPGADWRELTNWCRQKSHFNQVENAVSKALSDLFPEAPTT